MGPVDPSAAIHPAGVGGGSFPVEGAQSFYAPTSDAQSMRTFTSCSSNIEQDPAANSYVPHHQFPPVQQQQQQHSYVPSYPSAGMTQTNQHYISREPSSLSSSSSYSSSSCCEEGINPGMGQQEAYRDYQQQQQQPEMANMALQFMQAIQQSVNQVANVPDFGLEWVKPDYQFDPLVDDDLMDVLASAKTQSPTHQTYSISSLEDPSSPESKSSGSSCSSSCTDFNTTTSALAALDQQLAAVENVTLTQRTMEELYEALEEYSELYNSH